jgi:peptide/nickel transport system permease protein
MRGLDLGYFVRRIGMFFLVVFVAATFNFFIPRLAPGNPIGAITSRMANASTGIENGKEMFDAYRQRFGLDQPLLPPGHAAALSLRVYQQGLAHERGLR